MGDRYNYDHGIPCQNPHCNSYGRPHPNCKCGGSGAAFLETHGQGFHETGFAKGGSVHFCASGVPHDSKCEHFASGGDVAGNMEFQQNPELALDHAILANGLLHALTKTGRSRSPDPHKVSSDFLDSARHGRKALDAHAESLLAEKAYPIRANPEDVEALREHIDNIRMNPQLAQEVGGNLGDTLPNHQIQLAGKLANVMNYFSAIKPMSRQGAPLDKIEEPTDRQKAKYMRQLAVAQNPATVFDKARNSMLDPQDMATLKTLYPRLHQSMAERAGDAIVSAKASGQEPPRRSRRGLSQLVGQPLSYSQTPNAAQAIIRANAGPQQPPAPGKKPKKATNKAVDESNKQAQLEATPMQASQIANKAQ